MTGYLPDIYKALVSSPTDPQLHTKCVYVCVSVRMCARAKEGGYI